MANIDTLNTKLVAIGDAIREKTGKEDTLTLDEMPTEIESISGGGDFPDTFFSMIYLNDKERFSGLLPSKITYIYNHPDIMRFSPSTLDQDINSPQLDENVNELIIDLSNVSLPSTSPSERTVMQRFFIINDSSITKLPKITIINPNNMQYRFDGVAYPYYYGLIQIPSNTIVTLELKDIEFLKQFYKLLGYRENTQQIWYAQTYTQINSLILGSRGAISNPQLLLDNFQFDTLGTSNQPSYFSLVMFGFYNFAFGSTCYNVHIDRGNYTISNNKMFFKEPSRGVVYNYVMNYLKVSDFTWETDANNQPLSLTNIANQSLYLINGGTYQGLNGGSWTISGIQNFFRTLPDTSEGEGNNKIICNQISGLMGDLRTYFDNIPEETIASLSDRGWTVTLS